MPRSWSIRADWELLEASSPEERAGFAAIGIRVHDSWLTEGLDRLVQRVRQAPLLSSYHLAEWFAWNWWRLRWEPRKASREWGLSHRLASIGGGYIWPNIEIASDGRYVTMISRSTHEREGTPFRYINDSNSLIPASEFEAEIDDFIEQVLQRLDDQQVRSSNLQTVWHALLEERNTPEIARRRKLEALLGEDPDEMDEALLLQLIDDEARIGRTAMEEIAANRNQGQSVPGSAELQQISRQTGFSVVPSQGVALSDRSFAQSSKLTAAWQLGERAAQALRIQESLGDRPLEDGQLADMFGTKAEALQAPRSQTENLGLSFALVEKSSQGQVVLRSRRRSGRRFELARLLGDRLINSTGEPVLPATRSYTYRQKVQRAFAAELLSPFREVAALLQGDYSMERQQDVAEHFQVSELTIRTLLANHGRIDRSELDWEPAGLHSV